MPAISVIIPTRLRNHLLQRALRSLFAQTCADFEIILIDDNPESTRVRRDPSLQPLLRDSRLRLVEHDTPKNAARARNCGLKVAAGEWVTYLDDDDAYHPTKLQKQWERGRETQLPIGLCGLAYNLQKRRPIRQVAKEIFTGSELLLSAIADTKAIFHRKTASVFFDESLHAGEDAYFFQCLLRHFRVNAVFNVAEPLIEVFPQAGLRVNTNAEGWWQANLAIYRDFGSAYSEVAAQTFLARARLGYLKLRSGSLGQMAKDASALLRLQGLREIRFILNCFLFKMPWARPFLVS